MTSADEHFYVTLPSNSSHQFYGHQEPWDYRTRLHAPITLPPQDWEVGLAEFAYPRSWSCLPNASFQLATRHSHADGSFKEFVDLGDYVVFNTRYRDPQELIDAVNVQLAKAVAAAQGKTLNNPAGLKMELTGDGRTRVRVPENFVLTLSSELAYPLGFGSEHKVSLARSGDTLWVLRSLRTIVFSTNKQSIKSPFPVKVDRLVSDLYLYADIVERQRVGDALAPLLRTVSDASSRGNEEQVTAYFNQIHYIPLRFGSFESIAIHVADTLGRPVRFLFGEITVKLHFRRKKRRGGG